MENGDVKGLVSKLTEIMGVIGKLPKLGHNIPLNYDYVREPDVLQAVNKELAERNILLVTRIHQSERAAYTTAKGENYLTRCAFEFTFYDGDTGEALSMPWHGESQDNGDKGIAKATTLARKYFLLGTFLIETGDASLDPDADESTPAPARKGKADEQTRSKLGTGSSGRRIPPAPEGAGNGGNAFDTTAIPPNVFNEVAHRVRALFGNTGHMGNAIREMAREYPDLRTDAAKLTEALERKYSKSEA